MNRRQFVTQGALGLGTALSWRTWAAPSGGRTVRLRLVPEKVGPAIPRDFLGLGYETSSVGQQGLLSANNRVLLQFLRGLSPRGVIRIGGNTSDFATWSPKGKAFSAPKHSVINQAVVEDLGEFLHASGWKLIWGLNLGSGTPEMAAEEAAAVASSAGDALLAFEIGNEPDLFSHAGHRPPDYDYPEFYQEFKRYLEAVRARVPRAPVAGPDAATRTDWVVSFARDEGSGAKLLTHHYYAEGPPQNPSTTIENLLKPSECFVRMIERLRETSRQAKVPYRIVEINSCFGGGRSGVSDTLASALWGLEVMFDLAAAEGAGLNFETGLNQLGWISKYTPIDSDQRGNYVARPLYYAMLAFAYASRGKLATLASDTPAINFKAYAVMGQEGWLWVTLINKDLSQPVDVVFQSPLHFGSGDVIRLTAPAIESKDHVTLGGAEVDADGHWSPREREQLRVSNPTCRIGLAPASAAIAMFSP